MGMRKGLRILMSSRDDEAVLGDVGDSLALLAGSGAEGADGFWGEAEQPGWRRAGERRPYRQDCWGQPPLPEAGFGDARPATLRSLRPLR